jgi:hypothetical protein
MPVFHSSQQDKRKLDAASLGTRSGTLVVHKLSTATIAFGRHPILFQNPQAKEHPDKM